MNRWLVFSILIIFLLIIVLLKAHNSRINNKQRKEIIKEMSFIAIFSAFSIVLYFFKFNLPFLFPGFLEIQFSVVPGIIIGLLIGPIEGATVVLIKSIMKIPFSSTLVVGELADLIIGSVTVLITSIIYKKYHSKEGGKISLTIGFFVWVLTAILANYFILVPYYVMLVFEGDVQKFIALCKIIPGINETNYMRYYLLGSTLPFNALLAAISMIITYILYKKISFIFHKNN